MGLVALHNRAFVIETHWFFRFSLDTVFGINDRINKKKLLPNITTTDELEVQLSISEVAVFYNVEVVHNKILETRKLARVAENQFSA